MPKTFNVIFLIVVISVSFFYHAELGNIWRMAFQQYFPCKSTITYSLGQFDTQFGISKKDFLSAMLEAETIWEKAAGKNLFEYSASGSMKVNLVYDNRQETTQVLKDMGIVVSNSKASYDALKDKYDSVTFSYDREKASFEREVSAFEARQRAYEAEVGAVNSRGGGSKETVAKLNAERAYLNAEGARLNLAQAELNTSVGNINALTSALNDLANSLNLNVSKYNTLGGTLGKEFDEGVYRSSRDGQEIDIYQFENKNKLVRVLAHELGHALGLDHVEDPKAIMYRLNNGVNEKLTSADMKELKVLCSIK